MNFLSTNNTEYIANHRDVYNRLDMGDTHTYIRWLASEYSEHGD